MSKLLIIGLDKLGCNIIKLAQNIGYNVFGYDFDFNKIQELYDMQNIMNTTTTTLDYLLNNADIIILNIKYEDYHKILYNPDIIKGNALILNTNSCKANIVAIKNMLANRSNNFLPCNFTLFPHNIIINRTEDTKMNLIYSTQRVFEQFKLNMLFMKPEINDYVFGALYSLPYIIDKTFFRDLEYNFINRDTTYLNYNYFLEDIILNISVMKELLQKLLSSVIALKTNQNIVGLLNYNVSYLKKVNFPETKINNKNALKILVEKLFISAYINSSMENYIDKKLFNFQYVCYSMPAVLEYLTENPTSFDRITTVIKERIINLFSFLQTDNLTTKKFSKLLKFM